MWTYLIIRLFTLPLGYLPYSAIHFLAKRVGTLAYYLLPKFRKRALSNIALCPKLHLTPQEIRKLAKQSFQNAFIIALEYPKLAREKNFSSFCTCENPEVAASVANEGALFFCGHQTSWERIFLEGALRLDAVAIGRPLRNPYLYRWIVSIREKTGGKVIGSKNAIFAGLKALKKKKAIGIVGDQGMPEEGIVLPFLDRIAYTAPLPALLAYKTGRPIVTMTIYRKGVQYFMRYSDPIWPNCDAPRGKELARLMTLTLQPLEKSILEHPEQWLWIHNRWKVQTAKTIKKRYRHDAVLAILKNRDPAPLFTLRKIFPMEKIGAYIPPGNEKIPLPEGVELKEDLFSTDYRWKLVHDFTGSKKVRRHFKKLAAHLVAHIPEEKLTEEIARAR